MTAQAQSSGLEELYHLHRAELLRFLVARTGDAAEAEDVVQELWLKLQSAPSGPVANGRAYLYRMAQNLVLDRVRQRRRSAARDGAWLRDATDGDDPAALADGQRPADEELVAREETAKLATLINALPDRARQAFRLHKLDGLSHSEVAARLGISRSAVEKHMAVAMKHLRRGLKD